MTFGKDPRKATLELLTEKSRETAQLKLKEEKKPKPRQKPAPEKH